MARQYVQRITGGVIGPVVAYAGAGPFEATVAPHWYLHCADCGEQFWQGVTTTGAPILVCRTCRLIADERRIA